MRHFKEQGSTASGCDAWSQALPNGPGTPVARRFLTPTLAETEVFVSYWKHRAETGSNPYTLRPFPAHSSQLATSLPLIPLPPLLPSIPLRVRALLSSGAAPKISNPFMKEFFHKENFSKPGASCWA